MNIWSKKSSKHVASLLAMLIALVSFSSSASIIMPAPGDVAIHSLHQQDDQSDHHEASSSAHENGGQAHNHGGDDGMSSCQLLCAISCSPAIVSQVSIESVCETTAGDIGRLTQVLATRPGPPPFKPPRL